MKNNKVGVLILHGFAGNREEISSLTKMIIENGYETLVPVLAGHEASRYELGKSKHDQWIASAKKAYIELEKQCERIVIIGFSMGGLIGANICQSKNVNALVLVNTPIYFWDIKRITKNLFSDFPLFIKKYFCASVSKPFPILIEFLKILNKTKPFFSNIHCPILIFQTLDDDTVNPKSAEYIFSKVKGEKQLKKYEKGGHVVFCNEVGITIAKDILEFLNKIS